MELGSLRCHFLDATLKSTVKLFFCSKLNFKDKIKVYLLNDVDIQLSKVFFLTIFITTNFAYIKTLKQLASNEINSASHS